MLKVDENLLKAIAVTAELTGTELSEDAARVMSEDLSDYPLEQVMKALTRCRRELKSRMTIADVVSRIDDGRPGTEEAWAMIPKDESGSVVWTDEMAEAYGIAVPLLNEGQTIQARMAFVEAYRDRCEKARFEKIPVKWTPSLGFDKQGREHVLNRAVELGRITHQHAISLLPPADEGQNIKLLENKSSSPESISEKLKLLKFALNRKDAA